LRRKRGIALTPMNWPTRNSIVVTHKWSGLYDRMHTHEPDEIERRLALAADHGESLNA
jgi:hypothetical protein